MQPENTPPPAPPPIVPKASSNPYEFITNPEKPTKKSLFPKLPSGDSKKQRMLLVVGGGLLLIAFFAIIFFLVFGSKVSNTEQLTSLAKKQNELIRVADIGVAKARTTEAKNLATTAKLTFSSQQQPLISALAKQKVKLSAKELALGKNATTDQKLTAAEQSNRFDEVFVALLVSQLKSYQKDLKAAYDNTSNKTIKSLLSDQYKNASIFIDQQTTTTD